MASGDISTTLTTALSGVQLQAGIAKAASASAEVARLTTGSQEVQDAIRPLLKLQDAEQQVQIASEVVKAEGETLGTLIDVTV